MVDWKLCDKCAAQPEMIIYNRRFAVCDCAQWLCSVVRLLCSRAVVHKFCSHRNSKKISTEIEIVGLCIEFCCYWLPNQLIVSGLMWIFYSAIMRLYRHTVSIKKFIRERLLRDTSNLHRKCSMNHSASSAPTNDQQCPPPFPLWLNRLHAIIRMIRAHTAFVKAISVNLSKTH